MKIDDKFKSDYYRMTGERWSILHGVRNILTNAALRYEFCSRNNSSLFCKIIKKPTEIIHGFELDMTNIGEGLYIGHPYNITINSKVVMGKCCNIHKGIVIGQENRGSRKGTPVIGDYVWIGTNAAVVGKINVGSDVLIAPNAYVNCDVPSHSVVVGNPCQIIHRENATFDYINKTDLRILEENTIEHR